MIDQTKHIGKERMKVREKIIALLIDRVLKRLPFRDCDNLIQKTHNFFSIVHIGLVLELDFGLVYKVVVVALEIVDLVF
jgi:hypothetical protein